MIVGRAKAGQEYSGKKHGSRHAAMKSLSFARAFWNTELFAEGTPHWCSAFLSML